jgi:hypothetical protein
LRGAEKGCAAKIQLNRIRHKMHKVIVVGKVQDLKRWEAGFRTRGDLFKKQSIISPVQFVTPQAGDEIAVLFQVGDLDTFHQVMESPATAEAMAEDGIDKNTVKIFVLDKQFSF